MIFFSLVFCFGLFFMMPEFGYVGSILLYGGTLTVSCLDGPQVGRFNRKKFN